MVSYLTMQFLRSLLVFSTLGFASVAAVAGTLQYKYDALGRLTEVVRADGSVVSYTLDPAGNRTEVAARMPPGVPACCANHLMIG